jgi:hypothetical protein
MLFSLHLSRSLFQDPRVCVVLHLYDGRVPACAALHAQLAQVAVAQPRLKVLRMPAKDAPGGAGALDRDTLPVLVLYRGGNLLASLVRCTDQLGPFYTAADVEGLLFEHGALDLLPQEPHALTAENNYSAGSSDASNSDCGDSEEGLGVD